MNAAQRPSVGVGAIAVHREQLLMVRRGRGMAVGSWSVPAGHVELGETLHEAVVRETFEETGLEVVVDRFVGWAEAMGTLDGTPSGEPFHFVMLDFAVTPLDPRAPLTAGDDATEVEWVRFEDLSERPVVDGLLDFLHDHAIAIL